MEPTLDDFDFSFAAPEDSTRTHPSISEEWNMAPDAPGVSDQGSPAASDVTGSPKSVGRSVDLEPAVIKTGSPLMPISPTINEDVPPIMQSSPVSASPSSQSGHKTALRMWEEQHEKELEQKQLEEERLNKITSDTALADIGKLYGEIQEKIDKAKSTHRMEEQVALQAKKGSFEKGEKLGVSWERVCSLIDFSRESDASSRDTSRMKQLLFQLRQAEEQAQTAN